MNIALPLLLLVFGSLTFWLLTESHLRWYLKAACISTFCLFTIIFWSTIHSFLGWPANENDMPEKVLIHWVIIKEPNKFTEFPGAIYVLIESAEEEETNFVKKMFSYNNGKVQPRLFALEYNRNLHEKLQKGVMSKLKAGQPVYGKLTKDKPSPSGPNFRTGKTGKGDGSESQEQEWHFHELLPSDVQEKPTR